MTRARPIETVESDPCPNCDATGEDNWTETDQLPQISTVYECESCGEECYVYDNSERGMGHSYTWVSVDDSMLRHLAFIDVTGSPPDVVLGDLYKQGVGRVEAIDYHIVENENVSQTEWAERTRRSQPSVSENVAKAREQLTPDEAHTEVLEDD